MGNRVRKVSFLVTAFVVLLGFGLSAQWEAAAYRRALGNQYSHALAEVSTHLSQLDATLAQIQYANSPALISGLSAQIYGEIVAAQLALGELPDDAQHFKELSFLLSDTSGFITQFTKKAIQDGCIPETQRRELTDHWTAIQTADRAVASLQSDLAVAGDLLTDNAQCSPIFAQWSAGLPPANDDITAVASTITTSVGQNEARLAAADFLELRPEIFELSSRGEGALPTYSFAATLDGGQVYVEVAQESGQVVSLLHARSCGVPTLSNEDATGIAKLFLDAHGYYNVKETSFTDSGGKLTIQFVGLEDDIWCYPDRIWVSVALDTGHIMDFDARDYLANHHPRNLPEPTLSRDHCQANLAPNLTVEAHQMAVISTGDEALFCHQFICNNDVTVYVNAETGAEEAVVIE